MADEKNLIQAQETFKTLCQTLDGHEWKYAKDEEKLSIECGAQGEDLPMDIAIVVDSERCLVRLMSHIPVVVPEDKRLDAAIAISVVNNMLVDGSFDFDISSGLIFFRMTNSFLESKLGNDVFTYMLFASCQTIDAYNDKFLMLVKGMISIEQFLNSENN